MDEKCGADASLSAALERVAQELQGVARGLAPDDGMFTGNQDHYFHVGQSAVRAILLSLAAAEFTGPVRSVLDLPCGHGRVLRALRRAFPHSRITACDILTSGVDYCAQTFGAIPVHSSADIAGVDLGGPFDVVWCGSLLTHLDAPAWEPVLAKCLSVLAPGGVAIVTTHGETVVQRWLAGWDYGLDDAGMRRVVDAYRRDGFGYAEYRTTPEYGISLSSIAWVSARLGGRTGMRLVHVGEREWDNHQDVFAICRDDWKAPAGPAKPA